MKVQNSELQQSLQGAKQNNSVAAELSNSNYSQENLQSQDRGVANLQNQNVQKGKVLLIPNLSMVGNKYRYIPSDVKQGEMNNHPKGISEALNEYPSHFPDPLKYPNHYPKINICEDPTDYGSQPTMRPIDDYDMPGYQHYPSHYPKKGSTAAQDYYTHGHVQEDDSEDDSESDDQWDGSYFPSNGQFDDFYGDETLY